MKLIVGLGNPGRKYEQTRHNVGFVVLRLLAARLAADGPRVKFQGEVCEAVDGGEKILLLAPHTYMNRSGLSVRQAADFYKLEIGDLLVVCDDFQLPLGSIRLRPVPPVQRDSGPGRPSAPHRCKCAPGPRSGAG